MILALNALNALSYSTLCTFLLVCYLSGAAALIPFDVSPGDHVGDASALIDLFVASKNSWIKQTGWLVNGSSFCSWYGIFCDCSGGLCRVNKVDLRGNALSDMGQYVPDSIGNLSALKTLILSQNYLSSTLPSSIGMLSNLTYLDLNVNLLSGPVPSTIGNCLELEYLNLAGNRFSSVSNSISALPALNFLDLSRNPILTMPPRFSACPPQLQTLKMHSKEYSQPQNHSYFFWLCTCSPTLKSLDISGFTGTFPDWLSCLASSLTSLTMIYNTFNAPFSTSVCSLTRLTLLQISLSAVTGPIPDCLDQLSSLATLSLQNNMLQSSIPASIGRLRNMTSFNFNQNRLEGTLPSSLANLPKLSTALASFNLLNGTMDVLMRIPTLSNVYFSSNQFTGSVPNFSLSVQNFEATDNQLSGTLAPYFFRNDSKLSIFKISRNQLSGPIPLVLPSVLSQISIDSNNFEGSIPAWICTPLKYLSVMNVADNALNGTIPSCLGQVALISATTLNFSMNAFTGSIPDSVGFINNATLRYLDFHDNRLIGSIPSSMSALSTLTTLDLSFNRFHGSIPAFLSKISTLTRVDLASNLFSGNLGELFESASSLPTDLNVSHNRFNGLISKLTGLCNASNTPACPSVAILDARGNHFDCPFPQYSQLDTLFLRDACSPPYTTFAIYSGSLACALLVLLSVRYFVLRQFGSASASLVTPSYAPSRWKWLWHVVVYVLSLVTLGSDVYTMYTIGEYLLSRIDNCSLVNSYAVWKSMPAVSDWSVMTDQFYSGLTFPQFVYKLITTMNSYYGSVSKNILNPFDAATKALLDSKVNQFEFFCLDIQSGCALRNPVDYPSNYATECYMAFDDQAPFGGTSHRLFAYICIAIVAVRALVELGKASVVVWSWVQGRIVGARWSIDFVGSSVLSPLFVLSLGGDWSEYFKVVVSHDASYWSLAWRVVHQSLLCSVPLLCANLYFLFAVSQSGLQMLNMFSVLSACVSIPLTIVRAVLAWRSLDSSYSTSDVAQVLEFTQNVVDVGISQN